MHLPSPKELKSRLPLSRKQAAQISLQRQMIRDLVSGNDPRVAIVAGPCSIHEVDSAIEYGLRFKSLAEKVERTCFLSMRVYIEKPRSTIGWKGFLYDPNLDGSHSIAEGIFLCRKLLLSLVDLQIPIAMEFLDPLASYYFEDLVSWGFIGARTSSSQTHRQLASYLPMPVGFKNSTDGNLDSAVNGVISARAPHTFIYVNDEGRLCEKQSFGNNDSHIVLRGSDEGPNYDTRSVQDAVRRLDQNHVSSRILIDCSHGNSQKQYARQKMVFHSVIEQFISGNTRIMGAMLESYLEAGSQMFTEDPSLLRPSVSITDPCLDWSTTEELLGSADEALSSSKLCLSSGS
jgi:3-deoxy-7-phosphoheptulonate synthase